MPLGLWKSKWEIHREDMDHFHHFREGMERFREDIMEDRARSDSRWAELREETRDLRADYDHEVVELRLFNRELLIRLEKTYANMGATLELMGKRIEANTEAVKAQTEAIFRLVGRFEESDGRPPV